MLGIPSTIGASLTGLTVTVTSFELASWPGSVAVNVNVSTPFQFVAAENVTTLFASISTRTLSVPV